MRRAGLVVLAASTIAHADPVHVDVRCAQIDPVALDLAVGRELALDPKLVETAQRVRVVLECADAVHARLRIEPDPADGPLGRDLDLGDQPAELHVKLVAVAVAELIDVLASQIVAPPSAAPVRSVDPESPPGRAVVTAAPESTRGPKITVRAGIRIFADAQSPMPTLSAELEVGPLELGLVTAIGNGSRIAGIPYIVGVTASRRLICSHGRTALCLVARGELGFAGVSISEDSDMMEHSVHSGYGDVTLGFDIEHQFDGWKGLASVELGGADGLVLEDRYLEHLDGPFAFSGIGVRW